MTNTSTFLAALSANPARPYDPFDPSQWRLARFAGDGLGGSPIYQETAFMPESSQLNGSIAVTGSAVTGVVTVIYSPSIQFDASTGNHFRITLAGNPAISAPLNPADGQKITVELVQDPIGGRTVSWGTGFDFGTATAPVLSAAAGKRDLAGWVYSAPLGSWMYAGTMAGF